MGVAGEPVNNRNSRGAIHVRQNHNDDGVAPLSASSVRSRSSSAHRRVIVSLDTGPAALPLRFCGGRRECMTVMMAMMLHQVGSSTEPHDAAVYPGALRLRGGGQGLYMDTVQKQQKRARIKSGHGEGKEVFNTMMSLEYFPEELDPQPYPIS